MRRALVSCISILLVACTSAGDDDADAGVVDDGGVDASPGADDDDDRLTNDEEEALGTDPRVADTDGDGYLDGWEVTEGTDPLDPESRIYQGNWPYDPDKDDIVDPGWGGAIEVGATMPRFTATDQYGDTVDLYDLAAFDGAVIINVCASHPSVNTWCLYQHHQLARRNDFPALSTMAEALPAFEAGRFMVVDIIMTTVDQANGPGDADSVAYYADNYVELPSIPVLYTSADVHEQLSAWMELAAWPQTFVLGRDMEVISNADDWQRDFVFAAGW